MARLLYRLAWCFAIAGGVAAAAVALMTVASIVGRSGFSRPIQGDVEITQLGIALAISLALPWCQFHGANIIVDFFTRHTREATVRRLDAVGALLLALMVLLLAWRTAVGAVAVQGAGEQTMIIGLPMWWAYASLAPGLALTGLIAVVQAGYRFSGRELMREAV
jgi:TRAP-type C4-dicarboxylate transport system permease small subunit